MWPKLCKGRCQLSSSFPSLLPCFPGSRRKRVRLWRILQGHSDCQSVVQVRYIQHGMCPQAKPGFDRIKLSLGMCEELGESQLWSFPFLRASCAWAAAVLIREAGQGLISPVVSSRSCLKRSCELCLFSMLFFTPQTVNLSLNPCLKTQTLYFTTFCLQMSDFGSRNHIRWSSLGWQLQKTRRDRIRHRLGLSQIQGKKGRQTADGFWKHWNIQAGRAWLHVRFTKSLMWIINEWLNECHISAQMAHVNS